MWLHKVKYVHVILKFSGKVLSQKPLIDLSLSLEIKPQIRLHFDIWQNQYNIVKFKKKNNNTRVGSHALLQGIFPIQGSNPGLPHCRQILFLSEPWGKPFQQVALTLTRGYAQGATGTHGRALESPSGRDYVWVWARNRVPINQANQWRSEFQKQSQKIWNSVI